MTIQIDVLTRNARLDATEAAIGPNPILRIRTGPPPANTAAARSGTVLATVNLPADWMQAAAGASKAMSGAWADNSADAAGTAGHYEILESTGTTVKLQGTVTATGGGGDMTVDNVVFAATQEFSVTEYVWNEPNG